MRSFPFQCSRVFLAILCVAMPGRAEVVINEVMTAGSERLLQDSATGVQQFGFGTPWHATAFDDATWQAGTGPWGFGSFANVSPAPPITTNMATQMQNLTPTLYLRKQFTVSAADAARTEPLTLDVQFNDGFICYVNGVEAIRRNAGPPLQFTYHDQFAAMGTPAFNEAGTTPYLRTETLSLPIASSLLVAGANVVAIHALNNWESTSVVNMGVTPNTTVTVDNRNNFYFKGDLRIGADAAPLAAGNTPWRYFPGVAEPSGGVYDPALLSSGKQFVPWGSAAFDDANWSTGGAPFGMGSPNATPLATNVGAQVAGITPSVYFRVVFNAAAADLADPGTLQLLMDHDDGFVAYLNGTEVARDRLVQANAFTPHDAVAETARGSGTPATYALDSPTRLLNVGQNVLAVQIHNVAKNDADLFFRCRLQRFNAARLLVDYTSQWRYLVGIAEPVQGEADSEAEVENPEVPDSQLDWVELHNNGAGAASLAGYTLSDDPKETDKWVFPTGTSIAPGGYLLVVCDGRNITAPAAGGYLHANFKLSASGETIGLYPPGGQGGQAVTAPALTAFQSFGRDGAGLYGLLATPTPRAANTPTTLEGVVATPVFGLPAGFYPTSQSVAISTPTPGASIRYTTNGSEPTVTTGTAYTGPVSVPAGAVNGPGVVIRARGFRNGWVPSASRASTYLINQNATRTAVPAIAISGDLQRTLYRPFGIMAISGGSFINMAAPTGNNGVWTQAAPTTVAAADLSAYNNPIYRGRNAERPAGIELLYPTGAPGLSIEAGLRVSGSAHARPRFRLTNQNWAVNPNDGAWAANSSEKPSFNMFFRNDLGGDPLDFPLFPGSPVTQFHDVRLRAGKNDPSNPFIKDEYMRRLFIDLGQVGGIGSINTLYINGVYKGYYNMCEHIREDFFQRHHGSTLPWDVRQVTVITSGDGLAFQELITFARTNPQGTLANYNAMKTRLDMVNFVDYLILNLYGVTGDWPHNNYIVARERSARGIHRYYAWDSEGAFGEFGGNVRTNQFASGTTGSVVTALSTTSLGEGIRILYTHLRNSPEFKLLFADRLQKHFFNNGALTEGKALARWNALKTEFGKIIAPSTVTDRVTPWTVGVGPQQPPQYTKPDTIETAVPSRFNVLFNGYFDNTNSALFVPPHLVAEGLWPATLAPVFSHPGGIVAPGFQMTISDPNTGPAGMLLYTTDGRDPRGAGDVIVGTAYAGPLTISFATTVRSRVRSSTGVWSPLREANFLTGTPPPLMVSEIMYHPSDLGAVDGDEFEFIELKNTGTQSLNLQGVSISGAVEYTFPAGATLAPGALSVLIKNPSQWAARYPGVANAGVYGPAGNLDNAGETITVSDFSGAPIFSTTYDDDLPWPIIADGGGHSLVPVNANSNPAPSDFASWRASTSPGGSPGMDDPTPTIRVNEVLANASTGLKDSVELYNPTSAEVNIGGWFLSDNLAVPRKYRIPFGITVSAGGYRVFDEDQFNTNPGVGNAFSFLEYGDDVVLSSADSSGNLTGYQHHVPFGAAESGVTLGRHIISTGEERFAPQWERTLGAVNAGPRVGPVIVTEIMYLPAAGADDFLELRSVADVVVPLYDPQTPANTWRVAGVDFNFATNMSIAPGEIILLTKLDPATFRSKYNIPAAVRIFAYPGNLKDDGENVAIRKPAAPVVGQPLAYIEMDTVTYSSLSPWPPAVGNGKTLERVNAGTFGDDPANWRASVAGGSPAAPATLTVDSWLAQNFTAAQRAAPSIGGLEGDPDNDGLSNLREWAHGLNPWMRNVAPPIISGIENHGGAPFLTLHYRRSLAASGAAFFTDITSDLASWTLDGGVSVGTPVNQGDGTEIVTKRDVISLESGQPQRFIRLRVSSGP